MSVKSSVATTKGLIWRVLKYTDSRCTTDDGYSELISFDAGVGTSWSQKTQTGIAVGSGTRGISIQVFNYYPNVNATFYFDRFVVRESAYNSTDLAEMVPAENEKIDQAEIVSIDKETGKVKLSTRPYDKKIFGIVSTQPGIILQNENEIQPKATVALAGRVPVKISTTNGNIQPGDPITSSSLPGIGTKATQAGTIVGNAMEGTENWNEAICPAVSSLNDINWPKDDGLNPEKPCYKLPDGTYVGKIMAFVNTSWSDSQVYLTDSGDIKLIGETTEETKIYQVKDKENNPITRIGAFGEAVIGKIRSGLIETNSLVADTVTARRLKTEKLVSPVIETEKIVTSNSQLVISNPEGEKTAEFNTETKKTTLFGDLQVERGLKSATAEVGKITGEQAGFGELISATAEIGQLNAQGASFGDLLAQNVGIGQLEAESVKTEKLDVAQDATIAGTLYVDRVIARGGGFGELLAKDISMDSLRSIVREEINRTQDETGENTGFNGIEEGEEAHGIEQEKAGLIQDDGELDIDALLAEVEGWLNLNTNGDLPVDEEITVPENQISTFADNFIHQGNLTVLGKTTMGNVFIADQLIVGQIVIADNSLSNPNGTIYLQKEGLGGIDILAGKFMIDTNGNVFIAQHLTVGGDLVAGNIRPHEGENLVFDLANNIGQGDGMGSFASAQDDGGETAQDDEEETAQDDGGGFGKLLVKGINQETVAQIDASGSAQFAGTVRADSLAISRPEENEEDLIIAASENFDNINIWAPGIVTNASAGKATLPVGQTDLVIFNDRLADESMVYLTPTSDTQNQVLYVKAKVTRDETGLGEDQQVHGIKQDGKNYFVVGINQAINEEVKFNWWIIN
jgi:hypothetical protein